MRSKYLLFLLVAAAAGLQASPFVYISNCCNNPSYTSVISTATGTQTSALKTGTGGFSAVITPDHSLVYISSSYSQNITVEQVSTLNLVKTISLPGYVPQWMAFSPDGTKLYVTSADSATSGRLVGVNLTTGTVFATYTAAGPLTQPVVSSDGTKVLVGVGAVKGSVQSGVVVLDATAMTLSFSINGVYAPGGVALSTDGTEIFIPNLGNPTTPTPQLTVLSSATFSLIANPALTTGTTPGNIALSPSGTTLYVCEKGTDPDVAVIATSTFSITTRLTTNGFQPVQIAATADGTRVYITTAGNSSVAYYNAATGQPLGTIAVAGSVNGLAVSQDGTKLFVPNFGSSQVTVVNEANGAVVASIPVGDMQAARAGQIAVNPTGSYVFVTNYTSGNLSVISTATHQVVATVPTGPKPFAVGVLPNGSQVFVVNGGNNTVTVIDGNRFTVVNTATPLIGTGNVITSLAMDPAGALFYLGIINPTTPTKSLVVGYSTSTFAELNGTAVPLPVGLGMSANGQELLSIAAGKASEGLIPLGITTKPFVIESAQVIGFSVPPVTTLSTNGVVATKTGNLAFATSGGSVFSLNLTARTSTTIAAGSGAPGSLALTPDGTELWVANSASSYVSVFSAANGAALLPIYLGSNSFGIGIAPQ